MTLEHELTEGVEQAVSQTVVVVDMVGYSTLARLLEENTGAPAVAQLNRQIQSMIQHALGLLSAPGKHSTMSHTGDGAILLFDRAQDAHCFARLLHEIAQRHNQSRSEHSATRWFRIGIATGEITRLNLEAEDCGYAGITIANAVRLEGAARPGEIIVDRTTFASLSPAMRALYAAESVVRGKRAEVFRVRRYRVVERPAPNTPSHLKVSRRTMLRLSASVTGLAAAGIFMESSAIERMLHPLPVRRYVALHAWPRPAEEMAALVNRIVGSIQDRLMRAEPHDKQFVVLYPGDPLLAGAGSTSGDETVSELASALGANLVLAATSHKAGSTLHLTLQLLDAATGKTLRRDSLSAAMTEISGFEHRAAEAAARLLDLPPREKPLADEEESAAMGADAYQLLVQGKHLVEEPNDAGLEAGLEKLQQLVNSYPRFALGYAELAHAYLNTYKAGQDPAALELARQNTQHALQLNPDSLRAMLAQAKVDVFTGQTDAALREIDRSLHLDPMNPEVLLYKAATFRTLGRYPEEETIYRQIAANRPNFWGAYNELGVVLKTEARYTDAALAFSMATQIAPKVSLPLTNLGMVYLTMGRNTEAKETLERSIALHPGAIAYIGLGDMAFQAANYQEAILRYNKAHELWPKSDEILRDLGDCYGMLNQPARVKDCFSQAAALLASSLLINPRPGTDWMTLAFYHAKLGDFPRAGKEMQTAESRGAADVESRLTKAQILALMGETDEALRLVLRCLDDGISPAAVELAVELKDIRQDPRFKARLEHRVAAG